MSTQPNTVMAHVSAAMAASEARLYEQVNSSFSWLLGTLFAANGGAVAALVSRDAAVSPTALALFAAGVVSSILMGIANATYAAKAMVNATDLNLTLALFQNEMATQQQLDDKMEALTRIGWLKWPMYGTGIISLACLVGGMVTFACSM